MGKLTIYRLTGCDLSDAGIVKALNDNYSPSEVKLKSTMPSARLYLIQSEPKIPDWIDYLSPVIATLPDNTFSSNLGGVLFVKLDHLDNILYALTWGSGHFLIRPSVVQGNFGLRCAMNLMSCAGSDLSNWDPERLRSIRAKRIGANTYIYQGQFARKTTLDSFPFSIDADQLRNITGIPLDTGEWGKSISGGVSLHIKAPQNAQKIVDLCESVEGIFSMTNYRNCFSWIDNLKPISAESLLTSLHAKVIEMIKNGSLEGLTISIPSLVEFESINEFQYWFEQQHKKIDEPTVENFRDFLQTRGLLNTLSEELFFEKLDLKALDDTGQEIYSWRVGACITGEFQYNQKTYVIDEGDYFEIEAQYLAKLNQFIDSIQQCDPPLPAQRKEDKVEDAYVEYMAGHVGEGIKLHKNTIQRPGYTAIEICDVALKDKKLIHVKKGTSSSSLSHLFSQALVSADLLLMDFDFRNSVKNKIDALHLPNEIDYQWLGEQNYEPGDVEVVIAIMTGKQPVSTSKLLPFFSKINLRMRCEDLKRRGYKYSIAQISPV